MRLSTRPPPGTIGAVEIIEVDLLADEDTARAWIEVMARSSEAAWGQEHSAWTLANNQWIDAPKPGTTIQVRSLKGHGGTWKVIRLSY